MKISVDGPTRQLLLHLLACHITNQRLAKAAPVLNVRGKDAAMQLFGELQPTGIPVGAEVGDFVECQSTSGQQFELLTDIRETDGWLDALPADMDVGSSDSVPCYCPGTVRHVAWPSPLSLADAATTPVPWFINPGKGVSLR